MYVLQGEFLTLNGSARDRVVVGTEGRCGADARAVESIGRKGYMRSPAITRIIG